MVGRFRRCRKIGYRKHIDAKIALASTQYDKASPDRGECRVYFCDECSMYHLTSQRRGRRPGA